MKSEINNFRIEKCRFLEHSNRNRRSLFSDDTRRTLEFFQCYDKVCAFAQQPLCSTDEIQHDDTKQVTTGAQKLSEWCVKQTNMTCILFNMLNKL